MFARQPKMGFSWLIMVLFFVGLPIGVGAKSEVVFWQFSTTGPDIEAWENAITEFESQNPDIDVIMEIVPWADQQQKLITGLTTGSLPDVSMLGNNVVAQFQALDALEPLDRYFDQWSEDVGYDVTEDFWPGDKLYYYLNGHWWGSPVIVETRVLWYRKDLFEAVGLDPDSPPQTWEEMIDMATKLTGNGVYGWGAPMSLEYLTLQTFMSVYLSYGARFLNDEGMCGFDSPEFREALKVYTDAYKKGVTHPDAPIMTGQEFQRGFVDGKFAMLIESPIIWTMLERDNVPFKDSVGVAYVPGGPHGRFGFLGGWPLVLWKTSGVKDAAAEWIRFATTPEGGLYNLTKGMGQLPGRKSIVNQSPWTEYPYPVIAGQLEFSYPYQYPDPEIPQMGQIEVKTIQTAVQAVALGHKSVDEATRDLVEEINSILSR